MRMNVIDYTPELKIANLEQLPQGTKAPYLECIYSHKSDNPREGLIAKQWRYGQPYAFDAIIRFPNARGHKRHNG